MKKAIDQTVRDLKRGVNKKVLKVPGIEQKVLDATSNEPWDPHGSLLADIAMASRNYHEYQLIMAVIWRRITDTGKNWRHVYKALVVLEYLVAHGSERVIDEIKERSYQISMLSDFQYIDSSGRDQGNNVRRKSQSLVILANDKERVYEVRQKAAANRDKLRNTSASGIYRSSSHSSSGGYSDKYDYDRYEDQNGDGRSRERGYDYRDEDLYRNRNSYGGDGDCCRRESYTDDDHASSRGSAAKDEDCSQDERQLERKYSGQYMGGPPCYEDAVGETQSPAHSKRNGETAAASAPTTSPSRSNNQNLPAADSSDFSEPAATSGYSPFPTHTKMEASAVANPGASSKIASSTDSASNTVPQTTSTSAKMDLLGSLQDPFLSNSSANISITSAAADVLADSGAVPTLAASQAASNVAFDDPFGDAPFKATPATDAVPAQQPSSMPFQQPPRGQKVQNGGLSHPVSSQFDSATNFQFEDSFSTVASSSSGVPFAQPFLSPSQSLPQEQSTPQQEDDILAGILPPARSLDIVTSQAALASLPSQSAQPTANPYTQPRQLTSNPYSQPAQLSTTGNGQLALPDANLYGQPGLPSATFYSQLAQPIGNMIWQQTQSTANPYAHPPSPTANSYNQPIQSANPYFQPSQLTINPYNRPQSPANPNGQSLPRPVTNTYGQPPQPTANLYSQSQLPANPYAQPPQPTANSYSQSQLPANPYAQPPQPTANSYSQSQLPANPYAHPPQPTGNPYGQQLHASPYRQQAPPAADPYSNIRQQSSHPYGQPSASSAGNMYGGFNPQSGHMALAAPNTVARMSSGPASQSSSGSCFSQEVSTSTVSLQGAEAHPPTRPALQLSGGNIVSEQASAALTTSQSAHQGAHASTTPHNNDVMGNLISQTGANTLAALQAVPQSKDKFEPKSAVWADTLSRGLVNLNISGTKTNPLSDIGIDFDAINRKEKRMEKPAASPVTSTMTMGKAMGSGSGMGRAGASALRLPANPMMGSGMGMGMRPGAGIGMGMGMGMGMGGGPSAAMSIEGYGGMNQQHTVMGLNMGMGMGQGVNIQPQVAMHPGSTMPGGYHPMMGSGGYAPQQPYGGNYR